MALPPLPPFFGNPSLTDFAEVVPASTIDWLPQTPGWYLLAIWLAWVAGRRGLAALRRWRRNRYRREALRRLDAAGTAPRNINTILKLAAMEASSRAEVAALSGAEWTRWLAQRTPEPVLSEASLAALGTALYGPEPATPCPDLAAEARTWIRQHRDAHA